MPAPCSVCAHMHRSEIDSALARQLCNLSELARIYGLGRDALRRHRSQHLPNFLPMLEGDADAPTMSKLHAEYQRLYAMALDDLARAQAGVLVDVGSDGHEHRVISNTAIARMHDNVRKVLGDLVRLAADAAPRDETPSGVASGELLARVQRAVERLNAQADRTDIAAIEAPAIPDISPMLQGPPVADEARQTAAPDERPGGDVVVGGVPSPTPMSLDAVMALKTDPAKKWENLDESLDDGAIWIPNPRWITVGGSPAASAEERAAAGYPDIRITAEDIKAKAHLFLSEAEAATRQSSDADRPA